MTDLAKHFYDKTNGQPKWLAATADTDGEWVEKVTPSSGKCIALFFLFPFVKDLTAGNTDISVAAYVASASHSEVDGNEDPMIIDNYVAVNATLGFPMNLEACPIILTEGHSLYVKSTDATGTTAPRVCFGYYEVDPP